MSSKYSKYSQSFSYFVNLSNKSLSRLYKNKIWYKREINANVTQAEHAITVLSLLPCCFNQIQVYKGNECSSNIFM